jgi:hypothetical protein
VTPEQEAAFTEKLAKQFILIPKNRLYHVIGGALAILVAAFGINIGSVVAYLRTSPAVKEKEEITRIYNEVREHYQNLGIGTFLRIKDANETFLKLNDSYHIRPNGTMNKFDLHVHDNKYANGTAINLSSDLHQTWKLVPE